MKSINRLLPSPAVIRRSNVRRFVVVMIGFLAAQGAAFYLAGAFHIGWPLYAAFELFALFVACLLIVTWDRCLAAQERRRETDALRDVIADRAVEAAELLHAKEAAEFANAAKTRYLLAIGHEIRSPLNSIYGYAQLLERGGAISAAEAGGVIRRSAEHLTNLVEGLLEVSRIESSVLTVRSDMVPLSAFLEHIVDMFRMQAEAKGLTLEYAVQGRLPRLVRTDEKRLRQILINLLSNAIKYTREGGVTLSISYRSQVANIEVIDTGIGIAAGDIERIFEPFERGSSLEAQSQPGIGLGLAITRVLARILGGEIFVSSQPGEGSRFQFRIFLPEPNDEPAGVAEYREVSGYAGERKTVLVIDDDPAQASVLDNFLRSLGFEVFIAFHGAEGLLLAERCKPDIVLLDIQMLGLSGWEVAVRLRAAHRMSLRIVMISGNAHELISGDDGRSDHDAFLTKPVELQALLDTIGRQLHLDWKFVSDVPVTSHGIIDPLPQAAALFVEELRRQAKVGHVRGIEETMAQLEAKVPISAAAVAVMRDHVDAFDLRSLMKLLDDVQPR